MKPMEEKAKQRGRLPNQEVVLVGAVTESDLRYTPGGLAVLRVGVAGEWGEPRRVFYLSVKALGRQAEGFADSLSPGTGVVAVGRFAARKGKDGREEMEVVASRLEAFPLVEEALAPPDAKGKRRMLGGSSRLWAIGRIARLDTGYGPTGTPYARGAVALEDGEDTHFLPFAAFREAALALEGAAKGEKVFLEGALLHDTWQDREGRSRYGLRLEVDRGLRLLHPKKAEKEDEEFPEELPF